MKYAPPLRKLVGAIGLVVAFGIAIVTPSVFFIHDYVDLSEQVTFKAQLNAARVAQYIHAQNGPWQDRQLAELIQMPTIRGQQILQKIYDKDSRLVLERGGPLEFPVVSRSAPIVVAGSPSGFVVVEESLQKTLNATCLVAFVCSLIGFGAYFALRTFPLRVLDRTLGVLHETQNSLAVQMGRMDVALNNMSQGLVMFDSSARLVVVNKRYLEMFGLSPEKVKPGCTFRDVLDERILTGGFSPGGGEAYRAELQAAVAQRKTFRKVTNLPDGRIISIVNQPLMDGGWVATHEDITERLRAEERIQHLAHFDTLTNLPNRAAFYDRMEAVLSRLRRSESIAVFSLDLDRFKGVNETLGHPVGDLLLQAAADRIRHCVRGEDLAARLSGDEFAIVQIASKQSSDISAFAARLIAAVEAPYELNGQQVLVGASIGIAVAPGDGRKPDVLMKNADMALSRAKADGGGVYRFFELAMDARMQARRALELDLRKAVVNGEFELYYQPIVDVKTRQITSCEALIRWHHPDLGMIAPAEFISIAEETGLIVPLGEWVIRQACAEAIRWPKHMTVAVNLSPAQFKSRNLMPTIVGALATSGLPAKRLDLEITELVLLEDNDGAFAALHQLHGLGIRVAMDDFGTGYSSLGYLRRFPFDKIKIDQSFIRDLPKKEDSIAIIRAVVGLCSSMGITTTAEGVETQEQLARLTAEGCDEVQGFLFSPPRPAAELPRLFKELAPRVEAVA